MEPAWPLVTLALPAISAFYLCRRLGPWPSQAAALLSGSTAYIVLLLLSVHIAAVLELFGVVDHLTIPHITAVGFVISAILGIVLSLCPLRHPPDEPRTLAKPLDVFSLSFKVAFAVVTASWGVFAVNLFSSYPTGWDALAYHLPVAVRWLQEGSFRIPPSGDWQYGLPGNAEIGIMLWLATGWQTSASNFSLLAALVAAIAVYSLARRLVDNAATAVLATLVFLTVPIVQFQAFSCYVDLYGAAFVLAALAIFLGRNEPPARLTSHQWYIVAISLSGCACGVAVGTKPTFWVYAAAFLVSTLAVLWAEGRRRSRSPLVPAGLLVACVLLPCTFWFLRGWFQEGNPFYPLRVEAMGWTIFQGFRTAEITDEAYDLNFVRARWEWLVYPWIEYTRSGNYYSIGSGLGATWATFVPLGVAYSLYLTGWRRPGTGAVTRSALAVAFVALSVIWWIALRRMPRFGIPLIALACVLSSSMIDMLRHSKSALFQWLVLLSVATTALLATFEPLHELLGRIRTQTWDRAGVYGYTPLIDTLPKGSSVLDMNMVRLNTFALAGVHLTNRVVPRSWLPSQITRVDLLSERINYIYDTYPFSPDDLGAAGARLIAKGEIGDHPGGRWRIWEVTTHATFRGLTRNPQR